MLSSTVLQGSVYRFDHGVFPRTQQNLPQMGAVQRLPLLVSRGEMTSILCVDGLLSLAEEEVRLIKPYKLGPASSLRSQGPELMWFTSCHGQERAMYTPRL
jgi:hypothetical protein